MSESLDTPELRSFFYEHLNRVYCAKSHLLERLPELEEQCNFEDLKDVIKLTTSQIEQQVLQLNRVYQQLKQNYTFENCEGLISFLEEIFIKIHNQGTDKTLRDAFVLSYLYYIESLEMATFRILIMAAQKPGFAAVLPLLSETYTDAKADRALIIHLTESKSA